MNRNSDVELRGATEQATVRKLMNGRDGYPAHAPDTEGQGDDGLLHVSYPDSDDDLKKISREAFLEEFENGGLALVYAAADFDVEGDSRAALK